MSNIFLVQMLFRHVGKVGDCEGINHQAIALYGEDNRAAWEVRFYQDIERLYHLVQVELMDMDQANGHLWDETCIEQDTVGVQIHKTMYLCNWCAASIINKHAGEASGFLVMATAISDPHGAILVITDRKTEAGAVLGNLHGNIKESSILEMLKSTGITDLRFKP